MREGLGLRRGGGTCDPPAIRAESRDHPLLTVQPLDTERANKASSTQLEMGLSGILGYEMAPGADVAALATIAET